MGIAPNKLLSHSSLPAFAVISLLMLALISITSILLVQSLRPCVHAPVNLDTDFTRVSAAPATPTPATTTLATAAAAAAAPAAAAPDATTPAASAGGEGDWLEEMAGEFAEAKL